MKTLFISLLLMSGAIAATAQDESPSLTKQWATDTNTVKVPESVLFDAKRNVLFVSCIGPGSPDAKDANGYIAQLSPDGKTINAKWVTGLNSPKGLGLYKNKLYVADQTELVEIDVAKGTIVKHYPIDSSRFLNDITIDTKGVVYVSDSHTKKIHQLKEGKLTTIIEGLKGPNGLLATPEAFYILDAGEVCTWEKDGTVKRILNVAKGTDGIEKVKGQEFIVSCWGGEVYYVDLAKLTTKKLLDTKAEKSNTADIGYDPKKKIVFIPTFFASSVVAYQLK